METDGPRSVTRGERYDHARGRGADGDRGGWRATDLLTATLECGGEPFRAPSQERGGAGTGLARRSRARSAGGAHSIAGRSERADGVPVRMTAGPQGP